MTIPDIKQPGPGDTICLLVGDMNPPTLDERRMAEALLARPELAGVWLCPLCPSGTNNHVRNMCTIFCAEYSAAQGNLLTMCSAGIDKALKNPSDIAAWARSRYPDMKFRLGGLLLPVSDQEPSYFVRFFGQSEAPVGTIPVALDKFHCVGERIRERIVSGHDESRNFLPGVWAYVQEHKLYR